MSQDAGARRHSSNLTGNFSFVAFQTLEAQNKRCVYVRKADRLDLRAAIY